MLFLPDARASPPSMLLASRLFILDIESTLIPFLQHDYSSVILYFINNGSSCDSEGAVEYNKRSGCDRCLIMVEKGSLRNTLGQC